MSVGFDTSVKNYDSNFCLESFVKKIQYNVFALEAEKKKSEYHHRISFG